MFERKGNRQAVMRPLNKRHRWIVGLIGVLLLACVLCLAGAIAYGMRYQSLTEERDVAVQSPSHPDVVYCTMDGIRLTMDIYLPAGAQVGSRPAVVYLHGGGWVGGDKRKGNGLADIPELVKRGYLVASVNYRLATRARFPAQIQDVKCAVRYLRAHAADYALDSQRIGAMGGSAGGHLVSLLGLTDSIAGFDEGEHLDQSSRVSAVIDMFGPADLTSDDMNLLSRYLRYRALGVWPGHSPILARASPVNYIKTPAPPFLILQGEQDDVVPAAQSRLFYERLKAAGVDVQLVMVKNANHNFAPTGGPVQPSRAEITWLIADFFDQKLANATR